MALVSLQNVSIGYRGPNLLEDVSCQIEAGGRIGLLGRNGAGKSTLLKILQGEVLPDHGAITLASDCTTAYLQQDVPVGTNQTIAQVVAAGLTPKYQNLEHHWEGEHLVEKTLSKMELQGEAEFEKLSSGMKRRVLLAKAIVCQPDLLLLDEPTNHLDIQAIDWLERFLSQWPGTLIFVTHDRMFLRKVATRILEIERGQLFDWSCDYDTFLARKDEALAAQEKQDALFDKKLAQEEAWIRQGIKARRTRNEGRVRALVAMRKERQERRSDSGVAKLQIQAGERSGNLVAEAKNISFSYPGRSILENFTATIMRGDKIGVIGPNGAGKTTLLNILLGKLPPSKGTVRVGTNLNIAYFDQLRAQLNEEETIEQNVGEGGSQVGGGGQRKHIIGYLQDFLFTPERARTPIKFLSGGERNRVLLAKLFSKTANLIVLDEPTNDLDAETLEMLEAKLVEYEGTILVVSHDRAFLNNVVGSTIVFEQSGVKEYVGGYDDWLRQRPAVAEQKPPTKKQPEKPAAPQAASKKKLNFKEKQELEKLPGRIETLEADIASLHKAMTEPAFYQRKGEEIAADQSRLLELEADLETSLARWEELEFA